MTPHSPNSALYENDRPCPMCVYRPDWALCHPDRTRSPNGNSSPDFTNVACIDWDIADMEKTARPLRAVAASPDTPAASRGPRKAVRRAHGRDHREAPRDAPLQPEGRAVTSPSADLANHNPNLTDRTAGRRKVLMADRHVAAVREEVRRLRRRSIGANAAADGRNALAKGKVLGEQGKSA